MSDPPNRPEPEAEERWWAVAARDARADGAFVYAVVSTGVYCRPSCPAKRPSRKNVRFFASPDEATRQGFRACRRCRPDEVPRSERVVALAMHAIDDHPTKPTLRELSREVGVAPTHLQRSFKRTTGITPLQYARAVRMERLSEGLRAGDTVARASYEAGFDSAHALYARTDELLGMTPGRYRRGGAGETIRFAFVGTDLGRMMVGATERGVCALRFGEDVRTVVELEREFPNAERREDPRALELVLLAVRERVAGLTRVRPLALDVEATQFQRRVWQALRTIPVGETRSYKDVANAIGAPRAVRAVARACAANPVALAVPCHRVIRASGALADYRWGVDRKQALLTRERGARRAFDSGRDVP